MTTTIDAIIRAYETIDAIKYELIVRAQDSLERATWSEPIARIRLRESIKTRIFDDVAWNVRNALRGD